MGNLWQMGAHSLLGKPNPSKSPFSRKGASSVSLGEKRQKAMDLT